MTRSRRATYVRFLAVFSLLVVLGLGSSVYVLVKERIALPFQNVYSIRAIFAEASGVGGGEGQPVNVAGVKVGQVTGVSLVDGLAAVTLQIDRDQLPRVYSNASATLEPITPLKDMQIELDPGHTPAPPLPNGGTIELGATSGPVPIEDLLSRLDVDTRAYLTGLIASLDQGTASRAADIRRMLASLGPSVAQARELGQALAERRVELARLVHNLALVAIAASSDGRLRTMIAAGNRTLDALVAEDRPLREALRELPASVDAASRTLRDVVPFAASLGPTLRALTPAVRMLPMTLESLQALSRTGVPALAGHIRPFVREAQPLVRDLAPALSDINQAAPHLTGTAQTLNYALNELAYNPGGGDDGFLFWLAWGMHNLNSVLSTGDANGTIARGFLLVSCNGLLQSVPSVQQSLSAFGTCPN